MIRPLRRAHRRIWQVTAVALPLLLALALLTREPSHARPGVTPRLPAAETAWPGLPLALRREASGLRVRALSPLPAPDLLLYATAGPAGPGQALPAAAVFLGSVSETTQTLGAPPASSTQLVLFSLAHGAVVGTAPVPPEGR